MQFPRSGQNLFLGEPQSSNVILVIFRGHLLDETLPSIEEKLLVPRAWQCSAGKGAAGILLKQTFEQQV